MFQLTDGTYSRRTDVVAYLKEHPGVSIEAVIRGYSTTEWRRMTGRTLSKEKIKDYNRQRKITIFEAYGGAFCCCCGEANLMYLALDHIKNDAPERARNGEPRSGNQLYSYLMAHGFPEGFQVLCHNCNWAKRLGARCHGKKG